MYSLVMLAAMTAGPEVPKNLLCPVTPSKYGSGFWSRYSFLDCCAPARYGWVTCWTKGFGAYPGNARGICGGCGPSYGPFFRPSPCACAGAACGYGGGGCGHGGGGFCGYGWPVGNQPAYYTGVIGCPPPMSAPPYAYYTNHKPCCNLHYAFDTGLIGHSHGVGYSGFGGTGNFGFYGLAPMAHKPTTLDLPPFPRPQYPAIGPTGPATAVPMPPLPGTQSAAPSIPSLPPDSLLPLPPVPPAPAENKKEPPKTEEPKKSEPKKTEPRKANTEVSRPARATVVLSVPDRTTVTVEGQPLRSGGTERSFRTPELDPGREFVYTVRAAINLGGREEVETRQVRVTAGETSRVSFEQLFARVEAAARSLADGRPPAR